RLKENLLVTKIRPISGYCRQGSVIKARILWRIVLSAFPILFGILTRNRQRKLAVFAWRHIGIPHNIVDGVLRQRCRGNSLKTSSVRDTLKPRTMLIPL